MRLLAILSLLLLGHGVIAATPVTTQPFGELVFYPEFSAPASVESLNDSSLSAQLTARIDAIPVRVGAIVEPGAPLVELDCRIFRSQLASQQAALDELEAQIRFAVSQLNRARILKKQQNIGDEQVEQRATELEALRARRAAQQQQIVRSEIDVERCVIRAPFAGVITDRLAQQGELASPGTPLIRIQQLDILEVSAALQADQLPTARALFYFEYQGERYPLTLHHLLPVVDSRTRTREARFLFSAEAAPPGAAGRVIWRTEHGYLPAELLVRRQVEGRASLGVMLLEQGQARFHPFPDAVEGQPVRAALAPDQAVIIEGRQNLNDGDPVERQDVGAEPVSAPTEDTP